MGVNDLSVDQANKLDMLLSQENNSMAGFGPSDDRDRSLIEDSCDKKLRNEFYADGGPGALMRTSRHGSLLSSAARNNDK